MVRFYYSTGLKFDRKFSWTRFISIPLTYGLEIWPFEKAFREKTFTRAVDSPVQISLGGDRAIKVFDS